MTNANIPSEEQLSNMEADKDTVVSRENDDGIRFRIYPVSGHTVDETSARTYTRTFGHYFIDDEKVCESLDELVSETKSEQSVISSFQRLPSQAYEVQIEIETSIKQMDTQFNRNKAVIEIPSHSQYIETADDIVSQLEEIL